MSTERLFSGIILLVFCGTISVNPLELPAFNLDSSKLISDDIKLTHASTGRDRRSLDQSPTEFETKFRHTGNDVNLRLKKSTRTWDTVPFHYYQHGVRYEYVPVERSECMSIYQDVDSQATALIDFCQKADPHMLIDLPLNNTQHVVLPVVSATEDKNVTHKLYRVDGPKFKIDDVGENLIDDEYPKEPDLKDRHRRASLDTQHTVELLFVIDFTLYTFWLKQSGDQNTAFGAMQRFYAFIVQASDMRYQGFLSSGLNIRVELVNMFAAVTEADSAWIEQNLDPPVVLPGSRGIFDGKLALQDFETWIKGNIAGDSTFPKHDHAMLLTGRDLATVGIPGAAGLANQATVCTQSSQSIAEDHFDFISITIITHEIAHSLGAKHDGDGNTCLAEDRYIMAALNMAMFGEKARHPWQFSSCSVASITEKLTSLNQNETLNCLIRNDNVKVIEASGTLLGQIYDPDQQCNISHVRDSVMCKTNDVNTPFHTDEYVKICTGIWCSNDGLSNCSLMIPADGTSCGNKKWCINGNCVESSQAPAADDTCLFGDQRGLFPNNDTCASVVETRPYSCYQEMFRSPCCTSCASIYRNVTGCEYGDHQNCSLILAAQCYEDEIKTVCCETCPKFEIQGLTENCTYGDKADNCLKTETYCTMYPDECCATCHDFTLPTQPPTTKSGMTTQPTGTTKITNGVSGTTVSTSKETTTKSAEQDGLPEWVIPVAAVAGGIVLLTIIGGVICCCRSGKSKHRKHRYYDRRDYKRDKPSRHDKYGPDIYDRYGINGPRAYDNSGYFGGSYI